MFHLSFILFNTYAKRGFILTRTLLLDHIVVNGTPAPRRDPDLVVGGDWREIER